MTASIFYLYYITVTYGERVKINCYKYSINYEERDIVALNLAILQYLFLYFMMLQKLVNHRNRNFAVFKCELKIIQYGVNYLVHDVFVYILRVFKTLATNVATAAQ